MSVNEHVVVATIMYQDEKTSVKMLRDRSLETAKKINESLAAIGCSSIISAPEHLMDGAAYLGAVTYTVLEERAYGLWLKEFPMGDVGVFGESLEGMSCGIHLPPGYSIARVINALAVAIRVGAYGIGGQVRLEFIEKNIKFGVMQDTFELNFQNGEKYKTGMMIGINFPLEQVELMLNASNHDWFHCDRRLGRVALSPLAKTTLMRRAGDIDRDQFPMQVLDISGFKVVRAFFVAGLPAEALAKEPFGRLRTPFCETKWWRWRESNPRPSCFYAWRLHA